MEKQITQNLHNNDDNHLKIVYVKINEENFGRQYEKGDWKGEFHFNKMSNDHKKHYKCRRKLNFDLI